MFNRSFVFYETYWYYVYQYLACCWFEGNDLAPHQLPILHRERRNRIRATPSAYEVQGGTDIYSSRLHRVHTTTSTNQQQLYPATAQMDVNEIASIKHNNTPISIGFGHYSNLLRLPKPNQIVCKKKNSYRQDNTDIHSREITHRPSRSPNKIPARNRTKRQYTWSALTTC